MPTAATSLALYVSLRRLTLPLPLPRSPGDHGGGAQKRFLIAGGGAAETELNHRLHEWSKTQAGMRAYCVAAFAASLEVVPYTLSENAGTRLPSVLAVSRQWFA